VKPRRLALIFLALAALIAGMLAFRFFKPGIAARTNPSVAIEDGKTIDFSSGKPVVKDSAQDKAAIDAAVKEMEEAVKDVTFGPPPAKPAEKKTAESNVAPSQK
jgi:hypothetical protein